MVGELYSIININSCYYLVPDIYVVAMVLCKIYTTKIIIFYNNEEIARHNKVYGIVIWKVDITDYSKTLFRKFR